MNLKLIKKVIPCVIALAALVSLTSCNRGMGCPTFSLEDAAKVVKTVDQVSHIITKE
jgi:hypothetical protein